ncbi:unnamed protein product [Paramecium primaurelia]|uniref:Response regulatory domain-containing protein n=1 Tax=Paramecium primaurelia TaxID=5886 RepID=A0A8S1P8C3_PARPR|nr:unnamed protein product [Paramecium primaurelia]
MHIMEKKHLIKLCKNQKQDVISVKINHFYRYRYAYFQWILREIKNLIKNKIIRKAWCVANTGFTDLETKIQSFNSSMDYFLTKPLDSKNLHNLIIQMFPLHK